ncbi:hypothetical protein D0865_06954 [Hortaea werneckii]|uniref:Sister chromatid cohesion protein n=1 Tax=Hortaea werneckii TaxID=91943 RepID=A0A3M7CEU0_HORWE|nr:hypothetical protein D0865_06954 [Hortaea werneckii]
MDNHSHQQSNGHGLYGQGDSGPAHNANGLRVPTVQEALAYTPFNSVFPFSPDVVPPPLALPTTSPTAFTEQQEVTHAKRMLDQLSTNATNAGVASERCKKTLRDVQRLLHPDSLTTFKFKMPEEKHSSDHSTANDNRQLPPLSPFARMVSSSTDVSYHYLTQEEVKAPAKRKVDGVRLEPQVRIPTPQSHPRQIDPQTNGYVTPQPDHPPSGSQSSRLQAVIVSEKLTPAQRAEYHYMSEADSHYNAQDPTPSKKNDKLVHGYRSVSVDQKQKGDLAVQNLQSLLLEIFEAEDKLQPDTSEAISGDSSAIFALCDTEDGSVPVLEQEWQTKLDSNFQKVIANGRLDDLEMDGLIRVQRLCENAVRAAGCTRLRIDEDWSEPDVVEWMGKVTVAERGLIAARTLLRVMTAGAHIKALQSEDLLRGILEALTKVTDECIMSVVEDRPSSHEKGKGPNEESPSSASFTIASNSRKPLQSILQASTKGFRSLGDFLTKSDLDGSSLSNIQYLCKLLLFAENATNDRDSAVGVQNFETLRRCAMDVLVKIFAKYHEQRQFVLSEILTSLEKLPATKQSARQFRLPDAKPIQLVSAMLMRLVQTSATHGGEKAGSRSRAIDEEDDKDELGDSGDDEDVEYEDDEDIKVSSKKLTKRPDGLPSIMRPLHDAAQSNAFYIVDMLVSRAMHTSKSSDEPYRKLLDIFTEDFLNVLGSSDWPSAEMLLRSLVLRMISFVENPKSPVPSRTFALELLGMVGSGILELQKSARNAVRSLDATDTDLGKKLSGLVEQLETGEIELDQLVSFEGPYRVVLEYLLSRDRGDAQLRSAQGYHLMQWAFILCGSREGSVGSDSSESLYTHADLQHKLCNMILDLSWLEEHADYQTPSTAQGRLASIVLTLSSRLCRAFNKIFSILLTSMSSEHSTVKSRGSRSVSALLEKDPSILDRNAHVLNHIFRGMNDSSPLVRDSALKLLSDCIGMRPSLDKASYDRIIARTLDAAAGVRRRAMKMLKDIYLRNDSLTLRSAIADAIIARLEDTEETVSQLARQTMEEVWFTPYIGLALDSQRAVEAKMKISAQAALLVKTAEAGDATGTVMETLIRDLLRSKSASAHAGVCKMIVNVLFDGIVDNSEIPGAPEQSAILCCLAIFAKSAPKLFTASQLERLEPYTQNLSKEDDLEVYRSAITILRHVMPHLSTMKNDFLQKLQTALLASVSKLRKPELEVVIPCLWTIDGLLHNTERLINFLASALKGVYGARSVDFSAQPQGMGRTCKLMAIAGHLGNACDLDEHTGLLKAQFPWYKGNTVSGLIAELLCPFTSPKNPLPIRESSLDGVCMLAQAWPKLFLRQDVVNAFDIVFKDRVPSLEEVLLSGLESFMVANEVNAGAQDAPTLGSGVASGNERLGRTYVATDHDGASTSIAQRFLPQILRLALQSIDETSLIAAKVIVSINRQGLVHPKESGPALVALETCPNTAIANMAFVEHKAMHSKHETLFDKEYMRAVHQAYEYQKNTVGKVSGFTGQPPAAKMSLTWEVLKSGKAQVRKKFLANLCQRLDFNLATFEAEGKGDDHREFVRFCTENLAFFEYDRVEEIAHLLTAMEKVFSGTGTAVAQAIETEVLDLHVDMVNGLNSTANDVPAITPSQPAVTRIHPNRLHQLAVAAQICSFIWETRSYLRSLWNMAKHMTKAKNTTKDTNRAPNRSTTAPALTEAYLQKMLQIASAHTTQEDEQAICRAFVEMISVDSEVKVGTDEEQEGDGENGYETPYDDASNKSGSLPPSGGGRGRKRKSLGGNATPRKKGRPSGRRSSSAGLDDEAFMHDGWD